MLRIFYGMLLHGVRSTLMLKLLKVKVNISKYILTCIYTLELYILSVAFLFFHCCPLSHIYCICSLVL